MDWGDGGSFEAPKSKASKLPITPGRSQWALKLAVPEDEFRMATQGRVASWNL